MCLPVLSWAHLSKSIGKNWMTRFIWNSAWPQKQRFDCLPCLYPSSNINTAYCFWLHCYKFWTTLSSSKSLGLPHSIWKILVFASVTTSVSGSAPELEAIRRHRVDLRVQRTAGRVGVTHLAPTYCEDMCPGFATLESTRAHTLLFAKSAAICWHHHCLIYFPIFYWSTWQFCGCLHSSCCCRQGPSHSLWLRNCSLRKQCVFARVPPETYVYTYIHIHIFLHIT